MINRHDINEIMFYEMQFQIQRFENERDEIKKQLSYFKQNIERLIERENYFYFIDLISSNNFSTFIFLYIDTIEQTS